LKSKYHATYLGVFNERQLTTIDGILNKAMRQAIGLLPNFPSEGVQRPLKEAGLGIPPMRDRAIQMKIEDLARIMNKDTERGFTAHAHVHRLLSQFNHWPQEALESDPLKLPTLRILSLASHIPGLEYDRPPPLHKDNDITTSIREASRAVDSARQENVSQYKDKWAQRNTTRWSDNNASRYNTLTIYSNTLPLVGTRAKQLEQLPHKTTSY